MRTASLLLCVLTACSSSLAPATSPSATRSSATRSSARSTSPTDRRPVLDITFPAASGRSIDATFELDEEFGMDQKAIYAGFRVTVGDQPAQLIAPGGKLEVKLPVPASGVLHFRVDGKLAITAAAAGSHLRFTTHPLGGEWNADVLSPGPWNPAYERCVAEKDSCAADETDEPSSEDDPACPGETHRFCLRSPRVRLRGPSQEVVHAIGSHTDPEEDDTRLVADGPAHPLYLHDCRQPYLTFGEETVVLLGGYGEDWTVFRNAAGEIDASVTPIAVTSP